MKHAYKRLKNEHSPEKETWDRAIRCLRRGDHYLLVVWGEFVWFDTHRFRPGCIDLGYFLGSWMDWSLGATTDPQLLTALLVGFIVLYIFFPRQLSKLFGWVAKHTVDRFLGPNGEEKDDL